MLHSTLVLRAAQRASTEVTDVLPLLVRDDESPLILLTCLMVREISAGGVVIRKRGGIWWMAAIEPPREAGRVAAPAKTSSERVIVAESVERPGSRSKVRGKVVLSLPKGIVDPGEKPLESAIREVFEETGVTAELIAKLGDSKYVYTRTWGDGARVFKIVSFYLMRYRSGRINNITEAMRIEVIRARWIRLEEASKLLAYGGEKQMAVRALEYVQAHPDL
jgi:8-oxo-dGTP pyrophosphatase MutT (NUDIX family)